MLFTLLITSLYLAAVMSPGPDFFIVSKHALTYSRRIAMITAIGVSLGVAVHVTYSVFALSYIMQHSTFLVALIRYLGATYLIYLGAKGWLDKSTIHHTKEISNSAINTHRAFLSGFLCNLLNPKAVLFFVSVFTFITESHISLTGRAAYGIEMTVLTCIWFTSLAFIITIPAILEKLNRIQVTLIKILSTLLLIMGLYLLV